MQSQKNKSDKLLGIMFLAIMLLTKWLLEDNSQSKIELLGNIDVVVLTNCKDRACICIV